MEAGRRLRESVAGHNRGGGGGGEISLLGMRSINSDGLGALSLISLSTVTEGLNHKLKSINTCDEAFEMIFLSSGLPGFGRGMESDVSVRVLCRPSPNSSTPPHKTIRVFLGRDCRPACPD